MPIVPDSRNTIYLGHVKNASQGIAANYRTFGNGVPEPAAPEGFPSGYASLQSMYKTSPDNGTWVSSSYIKPGETESSYLYLDDYCMQTNYAYGNVDVGWTNYSYAVKLVVNGGTVKNSNPVLEGAAFPYPYFGGPYYVRIDDTLGYYATADYNNSASATNPQGIMSNNAGNLGGMPNGEIGTFFAIDAGAGYYYLGNTIFYRMAQQQTYPPQTRSLNTTVPIDGEIKMSNFYGQGNDTP